MDIFAGNTPSVAPEMFEKPIYLASAPPGHNS